MVGGKPLAPGCRTAGTQWVQTGFSSLSPHYASPWDYSGAAQGLDGYKPSASQARK